jgi:hypothetical protein
LQPVDDYYSDPSLTLNKQQSANHENNFTKKISAESSRVPNAANMSPDSLQHKLSAAFGFPDDDDFFMSQIAERAMRNKAKTDYRRRNSQNTEDSKTTQLQETPSKAKEKDAITE